mgnify:CR=1 FL=1
MKNSKQLYFKMPNKKALGLEDYIITDSNNFAFDLIVKILTTPQLRSSLVSMNKMLKGQDKKDESIKEKLYRELKRFK